MPTFLIRDATPEDIATFSDAAKAAGWSPARLALQLLRDFAAGRIAPSVAPPPRPR